MPNMWKWKYTAGDSKEQFELKTRGPRSVEEMKTFAGIILHSMTQTAVNSGAKDPELKLVEESIEPFGTDEDSPAGAWKPPGAKPFDINKFAQKNDPGNVL